MQDSSEALLQIADLDRQILHHQKGLETLPAKRAKIRGALDQVETELEKAQKEQNNLSLQIKLRERLVELEKSKINAANERMMGVNNQKEYMAVHREIDASTRTIKKVEDQILALEEQMEPLKEQAASIETRHQEESGRFEQEDQVYKDEEAHLSESITQAEATIKALKPKVEAELLEKYERLMLRHLIPAAVGIDDAFCGGCAASIRAQIFNEIIRAGSGECPSCRRLLFYRPKVEEPKASDSKKSDAKAG
ncbi:MAG: hypothetical protein RRB13_08000 [bacterium]|nr:hypothetical protein [bacterium]